MKLMGDETPPSEFMQFPWKALAKHWEYPEKHFMFGVFSALEEDIFYSVNVRSAIEDRKKVVDAWSNIHKKGQ